MNQVPTQQTGNKNKTQKMAQGQVTNAMLLF